MISHENAPSAPIEPERPAVDLATLPDVFIQMLSGVPSPRRAPDNALYYTNA